MKNKIKYLLIVSILSLGAVLLFYKKSKNNIVFPVPNMLDQCDSIIDIYRSDLKVFRFGENLNTDSLINEIKIILKIIIIAKP